MNLLEFHNTTRSRGSVTILNDITFDLQPGEFIGIIGPNGAGKSTILSLANLQMRPDRGMVHVFGESAAGMTEARRAAHRRRIAMILQHDDFNPAIPMTALEVVEIARTGVRGTGGKWNDDDRRIVRESMDRLDILPLSRRLYRSLSGGERQKVQLARALAQKPDILLLDEPATGLDMDWQERLVRLIDSLYREMKLSIIMTTHYTEHIPPSCGRIILLKDGRIMASGSPEEVLKPEILGIVFGCPVEVMEQGGRRHCYAAGGMGHV